MESRATSAGKYRKKEIANLEQAISALKNTGTGAITEIMTVTTRIGELSAEVIRLTVLLEDAEINDRVDAYMAQLEEVHEKALKSELRSTIETEENMTVGGAHYTEFL